MIDSSHPQDLPFLAKAGVVYLEYLLRTMFAQKGLVKP